VGIVSLRKRVVELKNVQTTERSNECISDTTRPSLRRHVASRTGRLHVRLDTLQVAFASSARNSLPTAAHCPTPTRHSLLLLARENGLVLPRKSVVLQLEAPLTYLTNGRDRARVTSAHISPGCFLPTVYTRGREFSGGIFREGKIVGWPAC